MGNRCDNSHGSGPRPLGNKAGNIHGTFGAGTRLDVAGHGARMSGGNHPNAGVSQKTPNLSDLRGVDGRSSKKDGQRYGGDPSLSGRTRGPAGIRSKKGRLK